MVVEEMGNGLALLSARLGSGEQEMVVEDETDLRVLPIVECLMGGCRSGPLDFCKLWNSWGPI